MDGGTFPNAKWGLSAQAPMWYYNVPVVGVGMV